MKCFSHRRLRRGDGDVEDRAIGGKPSQNPYETPGPVGFSAALLPDLWAVPDLARAAAQQRIRMSAQLNPANGLYGKDPAYYDQDLVLFATGYLDGRFRFGTHGELKVEWTR
jgi:endoglucanase